MRRAAVQCTAQLLLLCALGVAVVHGAAPDFDVPWAKRLGGTGYDVAFGVATDSTGVYVMGYVTGPPTDQYRTGTQAASPSPSPSSSAPSLLSRADVQQLAARASDAGVALGAVAARTRTARARVHAFDNRTDDRNEDVLVAKYAHDGTLLWTARGGGLESERGQGIAVSEDGRAVFVCGFTTSAVAYWGPYTTVSRGGVDSFLVRLDADTGAFVWATGFGGTGDDWATAVGVALHNGGVDQNWLYVVGDHDSVPYTFGSCTLHTSYGRDDLHVARVNARTGDCVWLMTGGGADDDIPWSAHVRSSDGVLLMSGHLHSDNATLGRADMRVAAAGSNFAFGPARTYEFTNLACCTRSGNADLMLLRIDPDAHIAFFATGGSVGPEESVGVGFDGAGNAYAVGTCEGADQLQFGAFVVPAFARYPNGFLVRVDPHGRFTYALGFPDVNPLALAVDTDGTCLLAGEFSASNITVGGPGSGSTSPLPGVRLRNVQLPSAPPPRTTDVVVAQVEPFGAASGVVTWAFGGGGVGDDSARGLALTPAIVAQAGGSARRLVIAGEFSSVAVAFERTVVGNADFLSDTPRPDIFVGALRRDVTSASRRTASAAVVPVLLCAALAAVALF